MTYWVYWNFSGNIRWRRHHLKIWRFEYSKIQRLLRHRTLCTFVLFSCSCGAYSPSRSNCTSSQVCSCSCGAYSPSRSNCTSSQVCSCTTSFLASISQRSLFSLKKALGSGLSFFGREIGCKITTTFRHDQIFSQLFSKNFHPPTQVLDCPFNTKSLPSSSLLRTGRKRRITTFLILAALRRRIS